MAENTYTKKGSSKILLARNDAKTEWQIVGGVESFTHSGEATTVDVTNSASIGDMLENQATGKKSSSIEISGKSNTRTGVDAENGYAIVGSLRIADIHHSANSCGQFMIYDTVTGGSIQGYYVVSSYSIEDPINDMETFTASLSHNSGFTRTGVI